MSSVRGHKNPFIQENMWINLQALAHHSTLAGSHKNWSPKANMQISLIKYISGLHMILYHFMVKLRTFIQLHEYKYNIKFCRWTVFKSVGELSSILSVKCLQKPCRWTVSIPNNRPAVVTRNIWNTDFKISISIRFNLLLSFIADPSSS